MIDPVAQRLRYPRSRIHVVPYYADPAYQLLASDIRVGYARARKTNSNEPACFLMLSTHEKRKNIELAIRALGILRRQSMAARLVCIGSVTPHTESLRRLAETEGVGDSVEFPGYLDKARIVGMLLDCTALLFVSRFEGYGLPPQDAQSIGCAVVLSDIACHRAVYDDPARWCTAATESRRPPAFIAVDDAQGLAQEMRRLGQDEDYRKQQCQAGLAYQSTFGGQQTADALLAAARTVIQEIA